MKKEYISAEIEVFMFCEKQVILASATTESTTAAEHDNGYLSFDDFI